jgi:hypothetical protein
VEEDVGKEKEIKRTTIKTKHNTTTITSKTTTRRITIALHK